MTEQRRIGDLPDPDWNLWMAKQDLEDIEFQDEETRRKLKETDDKQENPF